MGRSAKTAKRPSKQQKSVSKSARVNQKPLPPPPSPLPVQHQEGVTENKAVKKRRMMRAKAEKVSGQFWKTDLPLSGDHHRNTASLNIFEPLDQ
jgi:hypothetical protein